ncbi:hypothetical protein FNYG_01323 [Fusarium nygamai]|uniref:Uncharacterized protein n=1 Tax=Gibberella nygamai TaxID=42673 RepID=A0A2K0WSQ6_GIBNY|nr:hypothetical protein FNYG_01323 [Fusarium nygamai]
MLPHAQYARKDVLQLQLHRAAFFAKSMNPHPRAMGGYP